MSSKPSDLAEQYADAVLAGQIPACRYVHLACERFRDDLKRSADGWDFEWRPDLANRAVSFMQKLPHTKGKWSAKKQLLVLEPWQCFIECNLFGWVRTGTQVRRFRESYEEIPRKNGKSIRLAARGLYLFCADGEAGAEIYSGATTEKQAHEVFRPAWQMAQRTSALRDRFGIELAGNAKNPGPMFVTEDMSRFEAIIGKPGDGPSPHGALVDEYHEHDTDHMVDSLQTGMGAREQPLLSIITTAGTNLAGPCYQKRRDVIRILERQADDETMFGIIYGLDEDDRWDDPANLKKANPNYGISVFEDFLLSQLAQAKRSASKQNAFRTKHLNQWVGARTVWMNTLAWQRQQNRELELEAFAGANCWIGVDLASKRDIAAVVMLIEQRGEYSVIPRFYVPESALEENERYREYSTEGAIIVTPGNMTDYEFIETDIQKIASQVDVQKIGFDEWQANYLITRLQSAGFEDRIVVYNQTVRNMSEPMKEVEARTMARTLWHDGNTCMNWMMGNVSAKVDAKENVYPRKDVATEKIDGVVALIMAMGLAMGESAEYATGRLVAI
jgi:phage terminase large subunit-like protein